jgi:hypothetical protein
LQEEQEKQRRLQEEQEKQRRLQEEQEKQRIRLAEEERINNAKFDLSKDLSNMIDFLF